MGKGRSSIGSLAPVLRVWLAAAPLLGAAVLLQLFGPAAPLGKTDAGRIGALLHGQAFIPGEITFLALALVHLFACGAAISLAMGMLRRTPGSRSVRRAAAILAFICIAAIPASTWFANLAVDLVTYRAFEDFFLSSGIGRPFAEGALASPLQLAIFIPSAAGIAAVCAVAAAANGQLTLFPFVLAARGKDQAERIAQLYGRLKRCLYALGIVLVTSTVTASLFFHLPAGLKVDPKAPEAALIGRFADFASEVAIFWGCAYSLTLALAVGLPVILFQNRVRRLAEPPFLAPESERASLARSGMISDGVEQLKFVTALLAPLAAGPISNFVQGFAKF
jgi:hypothetical protein